MVVRPRGKVEGPVGRKVGNTECPGEAEILTLVVLGEASDVKKG